MSQTDSSAALFPAIMVGMAVVFVYKLTWVSLENYYPIWAYEAFTIPWLFTFIYSVFLYAKSNIDMTKIVMTRTLIPFCILAIPFYMEIMTGTLKPIILDCSMGCTNENIVPKMIGFEPYIIYLALFMLILSWFTESKKPQKTID